MQDVAKHVEDGPVLPPNVAWDRQPILFWTQGGRLAEPQASQPNNLPIPLTSFVGRTREIAEVKRLLANNRLVTLSGVGGCGKVPARSLRRRGRPLRFPDGVWLVELSSTANPALGPHIVAAAHLCRCAEIK